MNRYDYFVITLSLAWLSMASIIIWMTAYDQDRRHWEIVEPRVSPTDNPAEVQSHYDAFRRLFWKLREHDILMLTRQGGVR
jgi:hypothetical protein